MFWFAGITVGLTLLFFFLWAVALLLQGCRHLGHQSFPSPGAFAITNFVWWIGIGHAGTLISAIFLLLASNGACPSTGSPKR